jgi:hypothetical protein
VVVVVVAVVMVKVAVAGAVAVIVTNHIACNKNRLECPTMKLYQVSCQHTNLNVVYVCDYHYRHQRNMDFELSNYDRHATIDVNCQTECHFIERLVILNPVSYL